MLSNTEQIMCELDRWVSNRGHVDYSLGLEDADGNELEGATEAGDFGNYGLPLIPGIQQVRKEIEEFVSILLAEKKLHSVLEIGFGYYGSTHFLWRLLFDKVVSIEMNHDRIRMFGTTTKEFYKKWIFNDNRSSFIIGKSNDTSAVRKAYELLSPGSVDLLFIDGDHKYESVLADWVLYNRLVGRGGIIAFHDILFDKGDQGGVPIFINKLSRGEIDGISREIQTIEHSQNTGIAYYKQD